MSEVSAKNKNLRKQIPATQALQYTVKRALEVFDWLDGEDSSLTQLRQRILADAISQYITTLIEKNGSGHSLLKSYPSYNLIEEFSSIPIVKKCKMNRHNRSSHESKWYGYVVSPKDILNSDLKPWLKEISVFLLAIPASKKQTMKKIAETE